MEKNDTPRPGKLKTTITYLEMRSAPARVQIPRPARPHALMRAHKPTVSFYRYLYNAVGEPWLWWERRTMDDATLASIVQHAMVEIYVLHVEGVPAGYAELDRRKAPEIELAYFGLVPEFIGQGFGRYFLTWAVDAAWSYAPSRLWVHSCSLDHPNALPAYQRAGFVPYQQEIEVIDDPRLTGLIPPNVRVAG